MDTRGLAARDWLDIHEPRARPLWEALLNALRVGQGTLFLDAGCGAGGAAALACLRGAIVTCCDASPASLAIAHRRAPNARCVLCDLQSLPFDAGSFNAILAANSVAHCANPRQALSELRRVLTHDGLIAVATRAPGRECDMNVLMQAVRSALPGHAMEPDAAEVSDLESVVSLLEPVGLRCLQRGTLDCPFYYADVETLWRGQRFAVPMQALIRSAGKRRVKAALTSAADAFRTSGGGIRLDNRFLYAIATPASGG